MSDFLVGILVNNPKTQVMFSPFSLAKWPGVFDEIADINIIDPPGNTNKTVTLRIYVENFDKETIYAFKDSEEPDKDSTNPDDWTPLGTTITKVSDIRPWVGYLEANMKQGDPPIAVG